MSPRRTTSTPDEPLPGAGRRAATGAPVNLVLRVLDHQLEGPSGALLGNVDNLVLHHDERGLTVAGILVGPGGLGPRQPGLLGDWILAVWRRLHPREDPPPLFVPMSEVRTLGAAVTLTEWAEEMLQARDGFELWLREHVISHIPGATDGEEGQEGEEWDEAADAAEEADKAEWDGRLERDGMPGPADPAQPAQAPRGPDEPEPTVLMVSDLLGMTVTDTAGVGLGTVQELRAVPETAGAPVGPLHVRHLIVGPHRLGGELGYRTESDQGPWLLARIFTMWHRKDVEVPWEDVVEVDWAARRLVLRSGGTRQHPHERH